MAVRVKGLRELNAAFGRIEIEADVTVRHALMETARPVAESAKSKIGRYQGASLSTIRPRATGRSVFVTQGKRKVTGLRGDFGSLQMTHGLIPALEEHEDEVVREVERALDRIAAANGF